MKKIFSGLKKRGGDLKQSLSRTREKLSDSVQKVLTGGKLDEDTLEELEEVLIAGDVGVAAAERIVERLRERAKSESLEGADAINNAFREEVVAILRGAEDPGPETEAAKPWIVLMVGVNGTGKTTTLGKLAHLYSREGHRVLVAAADTFRAAAVDQLRVWADRAGVEVVANESGADPASVAFDAVEAALARDIDVVLVDTAGRLQTKVNLMEELRKIGRVVQKHVPDAPHEVLLVLDASTGQNAVQQAKQFSEVVEVTGLVLTKMDGTAKGGIVVAIAEQLGVPVKYLGLGEGVEDLAPFDAEAFAEALFA